MTSPDWNEIEADRDRAEALPESEWVSDTPETESRRLERQRNGLYQLLNRRAGQ